MTVMKSVKNLRTDKTKTSFCPRQTRTNTCFCLSDKSYILYSIIYKGFVLTVSERNRTRGDRARPLVPVLSLTDKYANENKFIFSDLVR